MLGISEDPHFWPGSTSVLLQRSRNYTAQNVQHKCKLMAYCHFTSVFP